MNNRTTDSAEENEMITYVLSRGGIFNSQFKFWSAPGIRGIGSLRTVYNWLKSLENAEKASRAF